MVEISTSILGVKKDEAVKTFYNLEAAGTDYFHIDVMDGVFVENNTDSLMNTYCNYLKTITNLPLDIHLMVKDVESYIEKYSVFEPNIITIHFEAAKNIEELRKWIDLIKNNNCKVGVSIKPQTEVNKIYEFLPLIHNVLIMTVEPGKGGQKLIIETIDKIKELKEYVDKNNLEIDIEADGGINLDNIGLVKEAGANIIVAGNAIINSNSYKEVIEKLKK